MLNFCVIIMIIVVFKKIVEMPNNQYNKFQNPLASSKLLIFDTIPVNKFGQKVLFRIPFIESKYLLF